MSAQPSVAAPAAPAPSYRRVFAVPGFTSLVAGSALARTGQQMAAVGLVLFVLGRGGSAGLAGLVVFLLLAPGLVISPIAGALLDRHGRVRLITFDYAFAALTIATIAALDAAGALPAALLCLIVALSSITTPLSNSGTRSLFPLLLPRDLWDRANAIDSGGYVVAMVIGPALVGGIVAAAGTRWAVAATAGVFALAAIVVRTAPEPKVAVARGRTLLGDAKAGIAYVLRSRSLRGLALCLFVTNIGSGMLIVGLPVLVLQRFGGGGGEVGLLFALQGIGGIAGAAIAGAMGSVDRERKHLAGGMLLGAAALLVVAVAPNASVAALGMLIVGASYGPVDIGLFGLRQRRTHVEWVGRVFAVSMALNFSGFPVGSALGGPVAGRSPGVAFGLAAAAAVLGAALAWFMIPQRWEAA